MYSVQKVEEQEKKYKNSIWKDNGWESSKTLQKQLNHRFNKFCKPI